VRPALRARRGQVDRPPSPGDADHASRRALRARPHRAAARRKGRATPPRPAAIAARRRRGARMPHGPAVVALRATGRHGAEPAGVGARWRHVGFAERGDRASQHGRWRGWSSASAGRGLALRVSRAASARAAYGGGPARARR
jgi:hypothetical protein